MFDSITLTGGEAAILWGYRTAASFKTWKIHAAKPEAVKGKPQPASATPVRKIWRLTATVIKADGFQLRQRPLKFVAPRRGGYWCWPVTSVEQRGAILVATLGAPEQ